MDWSSLLASYPISVITTVKPITAPKKVPITDTWKKPKKQPNRYENQRKS